MAEVSRVPDSARVQELWTAIKTQLAGKVDIVELDKYPTIEAVSTTIALALADYAKTSSVKSAIDEALVDYVTTNAVKSAISNALIDYATVSEVNQKIADALAQSTKLRKEVVDQLPPTGEDNVIYLIPNPDSSEKNFKLEYMWINGEYELIGSTSVDLSGYWSKEELQIMTAEELEEIING